MEDDRKYPLDRDIAGQSGRCVFGIHDQKNIAQQKKCPSGDNVLKNCTLLLLYITLSTLSTLSSFVDYLTR
jgi:hypothetical protein